MSRHLPEAQASYSSTLICQNLLFQALVNGLIYTWNFLCVVELVSSSQGTTSPENSSLVSLKNLAKGPGGPSRVEGLILSGAGRWLFDNTHMSASLELPQLKKIFAPGNRHYTSRTGQGQGRKVPFPLLTLHGSVESPCLWRSHGITLMPSFFLCPILFLLSHISVGLRLCLDGLCMLIIITSASA